MRMTDKQPLDALLPCPFCGTTEPMHGVAINKCGSYFIECRDCPALMEDGTAEALANAWNTRDNIAQSELIDELRRALRDAETTMEEASKVMAGQWPGFANIVASSAVRARTALERTINDHP